jgi:hypothetical protein
MRALLLSLCISATAFAAPHRTAMDGDAPLLSDDGPMAITVTGGTFETYTDDTHTQTFEVQVQQGLFLNGKAPVAVAGEMERLRGENAQLKKDLDTVTNFPVWLAVAGGVLVLGAGAAAGHFLKK